MSLNVSETYWVVARPKCSVQVCTGLSSHDLPLKMSRVNVISVHLTAQIVRFSISCNSVTWCLFFRNVFDTMDVYGDRDLGLGLALHQNSDKYRYLLLTDLFQPTEKRRCEKNCSILKPLLRQKKTPRDASAGVKNIRDLSAWVRLRKSIFNCSARAFPEHNKLLPQTHTGNLRARLPAQQFST